MDKNDFMGHVLHDYLFVFVKTIRDYGLTLIKQLCIFSVDELLIYGG